MKYICAIVLTVTTSLFGLHSNSDLDHFAQTTQTLEVKRVSTRLVTIYQCTNCNIEKKNVTLYEHLMYNIA